MKSMSATEFKAKCLAVLDEVAETGEPVTILKRGREVATLVPPLAAGEPYPQHTLLGTVEIREGVDLTEPVLSPEAWEAEAAPRRRR